LSEADLVIEGQDHIALAKLAAGERRIWHT
jgi:hypothetical protein